MTLFMLVPAAGFRLSMMFISVTCAAMFYILGDVPTLVRSLISLGLPVSVLNTPRVLFMLSMHLAATV